jgi:hypothetical protein
MLGHQRQGSIDRQSKTLSDLLDMRIAQRRSELVSGDRQILAIAKPRLNLSAEATLLQLRNDAPHSAQIDLPEHG